jgi:hypothetical protein
VKFVLKNAYVAIVNQRGIRIPITVKVSPNKTTNTRDASERMNFGKRPVTVVSQNLW